MKKIFMIMAAALMFIGCQNKDIEVLPTILSAPDAESITGELNGDDYVWTWGTLADTLKIQVTLVANGVKQGSEICETSYTHKTVDTGIDYQYVFKLTDGKNFSAGVVKSFTRDGAQKITNLMISQKEKDGGAYDAYVEWTASPDATKLHLTASAGTRTINEDIDGTATDFTIQDVVVGEEWTVSIVSENEKGTSLSVSGTLKIGKTAVAFLSMHATEADFMTNADDDEIGAWLWFKNAYPTGSYLYFGDITSSAVMDNFRVAFFIRDIETGNAADVTTWPAEVTSSLPYVKEWYKNGGNLLLWQHAIAYLEQLGRIPEGKIAGGGPGTGKGGYNPDIWAMAVNTNTGNINVDHSTHPLFRNIETYTDQADGKSRVMLAISAPGWKEDHNCLFFDYPSELTGLGNQDAQCYLDVTEKYGIYPLATWDGQFQWISQLNIWEARQGNTEFQGTVICVGNGGCEFNQNNPDGSKVTTLEGMTNNQYQDRIFKMAQNAIEYLKTR